MELNIHGASLGLAHWRQGNGYPLSHQEQLIDMAMPLQCCFRRRF